MYKIELIPIKVKCPGHPLRKVVPMEMRVMHSDQAGVIPRPCTGCDNMNGLMPCDACCAAITRLFTEDPRHYPEPIDPLLLPPGRS